MPSPSMNFNTPLSKVPWKRSRHTANVVGHWGLATSSRRRSLLRGGVGQLGRKWGSVDDGADDAPPVPPDGYSFTKFHGEMTKGPLNRGDVRSVQKDELVEPDLGWLHSSHSVERLSEQAAVANRAWSFGWLQLAAGVRLTEIEQQLRSYGAVVEGASGALVRARLPGDPAKLEALLSLPGIRGLGSPPSEQKLAAVLVREAMDNPISQRVPVFITLMADDQEGRWRHELEQLGVVVGRFDPSIRVVQRPCALRGLASNCGGGFRAGCGAHRRR